MIRTKKYNCGNYQEIEIFNVSPRKRKYERARKVKESTPAQKNLNSKRAQRYFARLCNLNFTEGDYSVDATYDDAHLPANRDEALRDVRNYARRVRYEMAKRGKEDVEFVYVISNHKGDDTGSKARCHIHMIFKGADRDVLEKKWKAGYCNTDKLRFSETGITGKALYMARQGKSKRCWGGSLGIKKPEPIVSDRTFTRGQVERIINDPGDGRFISKLINKNNKTKYVFTDCIVEHDGRQVGFFSEDPGDGLGFSVLIRMRRE